MAQADEIHRSKRNLAGVKDLRRIKNSLEDRFLGDWDILKNRPFSLIVMTLKVESVITTKDIPPSPEKLWHRRGLKSPKQNARGFPRAFASLPVGLARRGHRTACHHLDQIGAVGGRAVQIADHIGGVYRQPHQSAG